MRNIEEIIEKILYDQDLTYMAHLIVTLELNKIEAYYQHPENPAVFQREYDEIYMTKGFTINSFYKEFEDRIINRMSNIHLPDFLGEKAAHAAITLQTSPEKLERTIEAFRLENSILNRIKQNYPAHYKNLRPVLQKSYDEAGFITSYSASPELDKIK